VSVTAVICVALVSLGVVFLLAGSIGLLRFPDFYARIHAAGVCDTTGTLLVVLGLAVWCGFSLDSLKILGVAVFIFLTSPTAAHAIARSAYLNRVLPWQRDEDTP
jgi:multicomponent Na+:H+ antiporter subunit G